MKNSKNLVTLLWLYFTLLHPLSALNNNETSKIMKSLEKALKEYTQDDATFPLANLLESGILDFALNSSPFKFISDEGPIMSINHELTSFAFPAKVDLNKDQTIVVDAVVRIVVDTINWSLFTGNLNWARMSGQIIEDEDDEGEMICPVKPSRSSVRETILSFTPLGVKRRRTSKALPSCLNCTRFPF